MRVSIGSDHAGFEQKQALVDRVDYPDYAAPVAHDVADGVAERGVLVCGTGIGMAMAADKVPGVRAANIINSEFAALCREHNDANVITLSGRFVPLEENERILDTFFATDFGGGRHAGRVQKIMELD